MKGVTKNGFILGPRRGVSIAARFWEKVNKYPGDGCWEWTGTLSVDGGYGMFYISPERPTCKAHRYAWEMEFGRLNPDQLLCHKCDNPKCVRVSHLFVGTYLDNNRDMVKKERHGRMKFTHGDVRRIRALYQRHKGPRCKAGSPRRMGDLTHARIAEWFGTSRATISHMLTGRNWKNT